MKRLGVFLAMLCLMSCGTVHHAIEEEVSKASVSRGRLGGQELETCAVALRQAGHRDVVRVIGGTSEYNHSTHILMYYPRFLLERGGWGTAVIKVTGDVQEPTLLVLDVKRYERKER